MSQERNQRFGTLLQENKFNPMQSSTGESMYNAYEERSCVALVLAGQNVQIRSISNQMTRQAG